MKKEISEVLGAAIPCWDHSETADQILALIKESIGKVENPYYDAALIPPCEGRIGFEVARQVILKALEEE